jgi:hypothetical protein
MQEANKSIDDFYNKNLKDIVENTGEYFCTWNSLSNSFREFFKIKHSDECIKQMFVVEYSELFDCDYSSSGITFYGIKG